MKVLMVCLGNICRSPLAEGIMKHHATEHGLSWDIDSAGTGHWHIGSLPDKRSIAVARKHGIDITDQRCRQLKKHDLDSFDIIFAMDRSNLRNIIALAESDEQIQKVRLMLGDAEVPDPYYDELSGFEHVFQLLDQSCKAFVQSYISNKKM